MASYKDAVIWIADNDDSDLGDPNTGTYIVSISLVSDIFGKEPHAVYLDVVRRRKIDNAKHQRLILAGQKEAGRGAARGHS
ncbi:MAG: hypothetical protein DDT25_00602 [Chloroflexi bacterium]|nr:hypothetical protein [Chloroflexota bacterium]